MNYEPELRDLEYNDAGRRRRVEAAALALAQQWAGDREQLHAALEVTRRDAQVLEEAGLLADPYKDAA